MYKAIFFLIFTVGYCSTALLPSKIHAPAKYKDKCVELVYNSDKTIQKVIHCPKITPLQRKTCHIVPKESGNYPKCCEQIKNCPNPKAKPLVKTSSSSSTIIPPNKYDDACVELVYDSTGKHLEKVINCPKITPEQRKKCKIAPKITGIYPICCERIISCSKSKDNNINVPSKYKNQCVQLVFSGNKISKVTRCPKITDKQRKTCKITPKVSGDYPKCCDRIKSCPKS